MPSKKVFIKCQRAFVHEQIRSEAALEQLSYAKKSLGSYFAGRNSVRKGHGLNDEELELLLPQVLDVRFDDLEFKKLVDRYYTDINTVVPYNDKGLELEVGLRLDNSKPITYTETKDLGEGKTGTLRNLPLDVEQYVRYRHALGHPDCAASPGEAKGNGTIKYYIEDPDAVLAETVRSSEIKDKAILIYNQIKDEPEKVKMVLTLLKRFIKKKAVGEIVIISNYNTDQQMIKLRDIAEKEPTEFTKAATDEQLKFKYLLDELISVGLLRRAGSSILIAESGDPIGASEQTAVDELFKNPANAPLLGTLKAQYQARKAVGASIRI